MLQPVDGDEPRAGAGQVRVAVRPVGVNAVDARIRAAHMRETIPLTLPAGLGLDAAGVVDQVGEGVVGTAVGDAVFDSGEDTYTSMDELRDLLFTESVSNSPRPARPC